MPSCHGKMLLDGSQHVPDMGGSASILQGSGRRPHCHGNTRPMGLCDIAIHVRKRIVNHYLAVSFYSVLLSYLDTTVKGFKGFLNCFCVLYTQAVLLYRIYIILS